MTTTYTPDQIKDAIESVRILGYERWLSKTTLGKEAISEVFKVCVVDYLEGLKEFDN